MYAVMLVEDEQVLREGMRQFIPWEKYGFHVAAEAENGLEALDVMERMPIDLIFLDLHMPHLSGLEFLRHMTSRCYHAQVAVITGYNEFEYARTAIKHHVLDYLLKPLEMEEVEALLCKARGQLLDRGTAEERSEIELFKIVNRLQVENAGKEWLGAVVQRYRDYAVQFAFLAAGTRSKGTERMKEAARASLSEPRGDGILWTVEYFGVGLLLFWLSKGNGSSLDEPMEQVAENQQDVECVLVSPNFAISALPAIMHRLSEKQELLAAIFYAQRKYVRLEHLSSDHAETALLPADVQSCVESALQAIEHRDKDLLQRAMSDLYFRLRTGVRLRTAAVREMYAELQLQAHLMVEKALGQKRLKLQRQAADRSLHSFLTLRAIHDYSCQSLLGLLASLEDAHHHRKHHIIMEIKKYVEERIAEPILLIEFANAHYMSSEYLSNLFKKEEGVNFNQYLTEARIRHAVKLFQQDHKLKVFEVAGKVGYQDPKHFSKAFRKITGFTPKEFVDQMATYD